MAGGNSVFSQFFVSRGDILGGSEKCGIMGSEHWINFERRDQHDPNRQES